jgi:hypothetical protein
MLALVKKVDVIAITIIFIGVAWGIAQRSSLPAVPLLMPDSWGYLNPALSWIGGHGFQQTYGREWLYPAILVTTIKLGGDFSWIVRLQQFLSVLAAPLLWFGVRLWSAIFQRRSALCHGTAALLGAIATFVYVLGTSQIRNELTIGPEGLLSFFIIINLISALAYVRARWVTNQSRFAVVFGAGALLFCYLVVQLRPSWTLALIPLLFLLIVGGFGSGSRFLRIAPIAAGLLLIGGACMLPHLLQFRPDLGSRTLLPFNLVQIHAAQIVQNAERHHLLERSEARSDNTEIRFYQELKQAWSEARTRPVISPTLGFDHDYIQYQRNLFSTFQSEHELTDDALIKLCYQAYFRAWRESPTMMIAKIAMQLRLFLSCPPQDFSAVALYRSRFRESAFGPSFKGLIADAKYSDYINQPAFARYVESLQRVYTEGLQINRVPVQRHLAILFARLSFWIQIVFFVALFCVSFKKRFRDLRISGWTAALVGAVLYGNVLTVSIVHTLEVGRYRTSYAPALLLTLVIMTVFIIEVCERLFRRREIEVCQPREIESSERDTNPKVLSEPGNLQ